MKALVGASRGLLRDCTTSPINRFAALVVSASRSVNSLLLIVFLFRAARRRAAEPVPY